VSGVPYEVEFSPYNLLDYIKTKADLDAYVSAYCAELERENAMMRARMERLEDENRTLDALLFRVDTELMNLKNSIK
jgi:cell division protein FtsB